MFALSATVILGVVGFATEAGSWYVARSQAANVADAVAIAGALQGAWQSNGGDDPSRDANLTGSLSVYKTASVTAQNVTWTQNNPSNAVATQASVSVPFPSLLASLFNTQSVIVKASAVAVVAPTGSPACALSLSGSLSITQVQSSIGCYYAANNDANNDPATVTVDPNAMITAFGITSQGIVSCAGGDASSCANAPSLTGNPNPTVAPPTRPYASLQPATTNPFLPIDAMAASATPVPLSPSQITCIPPPGQTGTTCQTNSTAVTLPAGSVLVPATGDNGATCTPTPTAPCAYYNMTLTISSGAILVPGTYFFVNSSLIIQGGTVQCQTPNLQTLTQYPCDSADGAGPFAPGTYGVTIVLSGNPANLTIGSGATVLLSAPACATFPAGSVATCSSPLNGVLFYRASTAVTDSSALPAVSIADGGSDLLNGGMYFPNAYVNYSANTNTNNSPYCSILVGGYLTLGSSQFVSSCGFYGTPMPSVQAVQVVQ
jgi:hypothetical protein